MARHTISGRVLLLVTIHAEAHRVIDFADCYSLRGHVSMAYRAIHSRMDMRCMVESNVRCWRKAVNTLPGHILSAIAVGFELLNFRLICGNGLMAHHAYTDAGNPRLGPPVNAGMAIGALHTLSEVNLVRERNRLNWCFSPAKILPNGGENSPVFRRENIVRCKLRGLALR